MYAIPRRKQNGGRSVREADGDYLAFLECKNDFFVSSFELIQV